jgi:hypothetical protein
MILDRRRAFRSEQIELILSYELQTMFDLILRTQIDYSNPKECFKH